MTAVTTPPKVARNLTRSFFEIGHKRCNSNDHDPMFEAVAGELRATLLRNHCGTSNRRADGHDKARPGHTPLGHTEHAPDTHHSGTTKPPGPIGAGRQWR